MNRAFALVAPALAGALALAARGSMAMAETVVSAPAAKVQAKESGGLRTAVLAGGCFWGVEAVFSHVKGVRSVVSGYAGGSARDARYETVSSGGTGHAEAVRITYDPAVVRYDQLLQVFFSVATDPTQLNRQGPDSGTQYRNAIFPVDDAQQRVAEAYIRQIGRAGLWKAPVVTRIETGRAFFPAEKYHQDFALQHPDHPYIRTWDAPKVEALKRTFPQFWNPAFTRG